MTTVDYLDQMLNPVSTVLNREVAEAIVNLRLDARMVKHIEDLREKANAGKLSPAEAADYESFVEASDIVGVLQAKARKFLAGQE